LKIGFFGKKIQKRRNPRALPLWGDGELELCTVDVQTVQIAQQRVVTAIVELTAQRRISDRALKRQLASPITQMPLTQSSFPRGCGRLHVQGYFLQSVAAGFEFIAVVAFQNSVGLSL
jgi:hypothetical protein